MKMIFAVMVMVASMFSMVVSADAATFHGTWIKPVYTCDGLATLAVEVVKYDLEIPDGSMVKAIETMPAVIGTTVLQGQFSNLRQLEALVNRALRNTEFRDFRIVDVYVDER